MSRVERITFIVWTWKEWQWTLHCSYIQDLNLTIKYSNRGIFRFEENYFFYLKDVVKIYLFMENNVSNGLVDYLQCDVRWQSFSFQSIHGFFSVNTVSIVSLIFKGISTFGDYLISKPSLFYLIQIWREIRGFMPFSKVLV